MFLRTILISLCFSFLINKVYSQQDKSMLINGKQSYTYQNEIVKILFTSNSYVDNFDTLVIRLEITNISKEKLYLFNEPIIKFIERNKLKDVIQIYFGGDFTQNIEYLVSMRPLIPDSTLKFNFRYSKDELNFQKVENLVQIAFDLGILTNMDEIKKFVFENNNLSIKIENEELLISSTLLEIFLKKFDLASLFIFVR